MKIILFLALAAVTTSAITISTVASGNQLNKKKFVYAPYRVVSSERDSTLDTNHAVFVIRFHQSLSINETNSQVELSCNGVIRHFQPTQEKSQTEIEVSPGNYTFQFYAGKNYREITTRPIAIEPGHKTVVLVQFSQLVIKTTRNDDQVPVQDPEPQRESILKPVIYLYPEKDQPVEVKLAPKGDFTFTYPAYKNGWKGIAHPDGSISIAGKNYPYLFWEGEDQNISQLADYNAGFVVKQAEVIAFLEEKLTEMNLNDKEKTDFITFWGPKMASAEQGFAHFVFNKDYDQIATLNIQPAPASVFRVYLLWTPLDAKTILHPKPQIIESVKREQFYGIEWGGSELSWPKELSFNP